MWSLPMWGRGVSQQTFMRYSGKGFWDPEDGEPNCMGRGGDSFTEAATLVLDLGDGIEICQMEEIPTRPLKTWHCEGSWHALKRVR